MKKGNGIIYVLALIKFILPYLLQSSFYEPHRDEFLYLAEGHHLAFGFMEVPPFIIRLAYTRSFLHLARITWKCLRRAVSGYGELFFVLLPVVTGMVFR